MNLFLSVHAVGKEVWSAYPDAGEALVAALIAALHILFSVLGC